MASKAYGKSAFKNQFVYNLEDTQQGIYKYGNRDLLPNELMKYIMSSGIATRASTKQAQYIYGNGFVNDVPVDQNTLVKISYSLSYFAGYALHIKTDAFGNNPTASYLDFQCVRRKIEGGYIFNPTYGQKRFDKEKTVHFVPYVKGSAQPNMMLYVYLDTGAHPVYPIPDYYAGIEDIRTSAELSKLDLESVVNGFIPSAILTTVGRLDSTNRDEYGRTEQDYLNETLLRFTGEIKDANGLSERKKLIHFNVTSKEEAPTLQTFDAKAIIEASNEKRELIGREVCRLFGVNPVLVGYSDAAVLGNTQSIANASKELNNHVRQFKDLIIEGLNKVWSDVDFSIKPVDDYKTMDANLMSVLSEDEKRMFYFNLPPIERSMPSEGERILSTLNGLSPLLATKVIDMIPKETLLIALGIKSTDPIQEAELSALYTNEFSAAKITPQMIAERYTEYYDTVNMTYSQLQQWSETECSRKASVNRAPITRNLELLNINKADWTEKHYRWAGQTIAFIGRMQNVEDGEDIEGCGLSKREISLKNWAFDVNK